MSCKQYKSQLADMAAAESAAPERAAAFATLEAHLTSCADCRATLAQHRSVLAQADAVLVQQISAEPSPAFAAGVRQRIAAEAETRSWPFAWRIAAGFALTSALVVFVWVARRSEGTPGQPAAAARRDAGAVAKTPGPDLATAVSHVEKKGPAQRAARKGGPPPPPPVLVARDESRQLFAFYRAAWNASDAQPLVSAAAIPSAEQLAPIQLAPLEVAPLEMKPLLAPAPQGGEASRPHG
jgi:hypothetical protein